MKLMVLGTALAAKMVRYGVNEMFFIKNGKRFSSTILLLLFLFPHSPLLMILAKLTAIPLKLGRC